MLSPLGPSPYKYAFEVGRNGSLPRKVSNRHVVGMEGSACGVLMEEGKGPLSHIQKAIGGFQSVSVARRWVLVVSGMWLGGTKQKLKSVLGEQLTGVGGSRRSSSSCWFVLGTKLSNGI